MYELVRDTIDIGDILVNDYASNMDEAHLYISLGYDKNYITDLYKVYKISSHGDYYKFIHGVFSDSYLVTIPLVTLQRNDSEVSDLEQMLIAPSVTIPFLHNYIDAILKNPLDIFDYISSKQMYIVKGFNKKDDVKAYIMNNLLTDTFKRPLLSFDDAMKHIDNLWGI